MDKRLVRRSLFVALMGVFTLSYADAVVPIAEVEPNHNAANFWGENISYAQPLESAGEIAVHGAIGDLGGPKIHDVDFYSFEAEVGDVLNIDIRDGLGGAALVDTYLHLFGPSGQLLAQNDDRDAANGDYDASIQNYSIVNTGTYTVAVSNWSVRFNSGGILSQAPRMENPGDYTLVITGLTPEAPIPPVDQVQIEIKPGSAEAARKVNPNSKGLLTVAIYSSANFEVSTIDVASLRFGKTGDEQSLKTCGTQAVDINADGLPDLMCHFRIHLANFDTDAEEAILKGKSAKGDFEARSALAVVSLSKTAGKGKGKR